MECRVCKEEIQDGAKKCIKCGSYQDGRRYFTLSSSVLALMIALISVITWATPVLKEAFKPKDAKLDFYFIGPMPSGYIMITVTNEGSEPAFFSKMSSVRMANAEGEAVAKFFGMIEEAEREVLIIQPEGFLDLYFKLSDLKFELNDPDEVIEQMRFELMTVSFKAQREILRFELDQTHMFYIWEYMQRQKLLDSAEFKFAESITTPQEFFKN